MDLAQIVRLLEVLTDKVDQVVGFMHRTSVQLEHGSARFDKQCDRIENIEAKVDNLEAHRDKIAGEVSMIRIIGLVFAVIAAVGGAVGALWAVLK